MRRRTICSIPLEGQLRLERPRLRLPILCQPHKLAIRTRHSASREYLRCTSMQERLVTAQDQQ